MDKDLNITAVLAVLMTFMLSAIAVSCGIEEIGAANGDDDGIWVSPVPGTGSGGGSPSAETCYITSCEYPKGYDWMSDPSKGTVKCSLVVYADGKPRLKLAVGDRYCVSSDPDMHRMIGGQLYTDYSIDSSTVIKRNGIELFRYPAEEYICGMQVIGDDVYTLGQSRGGDGFCFRKNGRARLSRKYGSVLSGLSSDGDGSLYFSFSEQVPSDGSGFERYYLARDSVVMQVAMREDIKKVWDVILHDGEPCYVASVRGFNGLMLVQGDRLSALTLPDGGSVLSCRLFCSGSSLCAESVLSTASGMEGCVWKDGRSLFSFPADMTMSAVYAEDGGVNCVLNPSSRTVCGMIYRDGETYGMPQGYFSMGGSTAASVNGILHVGLSSSQSGKPLIWMEGECRSIPVNGFITSVSTCPVVP